MTKIKTFSPENPDGIERDMTAEEQAQYDKDVKVMEEEVKAFKDAETKKKADAKTGNDKLLALGLTQDEVTAMTGYKLPIEDIPN
tara:strand:+ start:238 stop:492 length:255 start_codon:yes stop_codon:yes gene_type:complete